jgi:glycosyltransferase involved in cell wall biosynthesis
MFSDVRVVVVVPAWNEAPRIARVVRGLPMWVDEVIVVDDASTDGTLEVVRALNDTRVEIARHADNRGVGAAIATGYRAALARAGAPNDAFVVMAGDGQMDPDDLPSLLQPIARGEVDYVKGDRFLRLDTPRVMPRTRQLGGRVLSWATSRAIGVPISDSQCGYAALARAACERLDLDALWPRYGYPNDLLSQLALRGLRIGQVPVRAIYADEVSRLKMHHVPVIAALIARAAIARASAAWTRESAGD